MPTVVSNTRDFDGWSWYGGVCACLAGGTRLDCDSEVRCHLSPFWCIEVDHRSLMTKAVGLVSLEDGGSEQIDGGNGANALLSAE